MPLTRLGAISLILLLAACSPGGQNASGDRLFAPALDPEGDSVDGMVVGHRLMDANQPELALEAYQRAAATTGLTGEMLTALGSANLALGRLNQAEKQLRRAVDEDEFSPEAWNNLGVVLMETDRTAEASEVFRKAYALDNGESDSIRDNLRLALAKMDNTLYGADEEQEYKLMRRGMSTYLIKSAS